VGLPGIGRFGLTVSVLLAAIACSVLLIVPSLAQANTPLTVTKTADTNDGTCNSDCSLREAISAANAAAGDDTITLPIGAYTLTRTGAGENLNDTGDLDIANNGSLTITGAGARSTTINGNAADRVFDVLSGAALSSSGLTITNGKVGTTEDGGGIRNDGSLTLTDAAVSGNVAGDASTCNSRGGGIADDSATALVLTRVALIGNHASCDGGGVDIDSGTSSVTDSTIADNTMLNINAGGAGVDFDTSAAAQFTNDTIAFNTNTNSARPAGVWNPVSFTSENTIIAANTPTDCAVGLPVTVTAPNLDSDSNCFTGSGAIHSATPMLADGANNGGPTDTVALLAGSPAIDRGDSSGETIDQRGLPRPFDFPGLANAAGGDGTDIGAFELQQACAAQTTPDISCAPPVTTPPVTTPAVTGPTGKRAAALNKCKKKFRHNKTKRKECLRKAKRLPV
jgi:CSLREA domain-containing protein